MDGDDGDILFAEEVPALDHRCCYGTCQELAVEHVFWVSGNCALLCPEHLDEVIASVRDQVFDQHPISATCNLPHGMWTVEWSWVSPPGRCVWLVDAQTVALNNR